MNVESYLKQIDEVIAKGPFSDDWESLGNYIEPDWYKDAKFGIFAHWGIYSIQETFNEWYPRRMYIKDSAEYKHHIKTYV